MKPEKAIQKSETLRRIGVVWRAIRALQISETAKQRFIGRLGKLSRALNNLEGISRKRYRKRAAALRHHANRILREANETLTAEIFECFGGRLIN